MIKLMKITFVVLIAFLLTSCSMTSVFIIENDSPNPIVITYSNWPERYVAEPRIGYLSDVKKAKYKLKSLPIADFEYGKNECEIIVSVPSKSAVCIAGMRDINVFYANKYFAGATLFIKTASGSIKYEGADVIKLFKRDSRYNMNFIYTYNTDI
jgi:hypothetical protein